MILYLYDLDNCRENSLDNDSILALEVEHPKYLSKLMLALKMQNDDSPLAIYHLDKRLNVEKEVCLQVDFFNEHDVSKSVLSKLEDKLLDEDGLGYKIQFSDISNKIGALIAEIVKSSEIDFVWEQEIEPKDFLKLFGFQLSLSQDIFTNCLNFILLCATMKLYKIIVFYNLKSILPSEDIVKIYRHCLYCNQTVVFVDSQHYEEKLVNENKIYVDKDFFDIKL